MLALFLYSLKVALCLGCIYLFYYLALRNVTFYNWNRWYLLAGSIVGCAIPLLAALPWLGSTALDHTPVIKIIPRLSALTASAPAIRTNAAFYKDFLNFWLPLIFIWGMLVQGFRLGIQFWAIYRLRRQARPLPGYPGKIYQVDQNIVPFSFGNAVFLNFNLLQPTKLPAIIQHELVHVQQAHTVDIIYMELVRILNWYNPFSWLMRQQVRQNLEFIADHQVLQSGTDKTHYQYLLLQVIGQPEFRLVNPFNFSPLKNRIKMMNKMPSARRELAKFLLVFPVMAVLLLACQEDAALTESSKTQALPLPPPLPPVPNEAELQEVSYNDADFLKRNPTVFTIRLVFQNNNYKSVEVALKSGKKETYNLDDQTGLAQSKNKYGYYSVNSKNLPPPPPPPPVVREFRMPFLNTNPLPADYKAFLKRNPQVKTIGWDKEDAVFIMAKSGRAEENAVYDLINPTLKAELELKYGKLPENPDLK